MINHPHRLLGTSVSVGGKHKMPEIPPEEEKFIVRSPYSDIEVPEVNLTDFVFRDVKEFEDNIALVSSKSESVCQWAVM